MSNFQWANPVRTGRDESGPTLAERTHVPDPAAVARLKRLLAEQRQAEQRQTEKAARQTRRAPARQPDIVTNLLRAAHARKAAAGDDAPAAMPALPAAAPLVVPRRKRGPAARVFRAEVLAAAVADHDAGHTWAVIARRLKVGRRALCVALRRAGYATARGKFAPGTKPATGGWSRKLTNDAILALHGRQVAGETVVALAAEGGVHPRTLTRGWAAAGLQSVRRSYPWARRKQRPFTAQEIATAVAAHDAGRTWDAIAAEMGINRRTLCQVVRRAGFPTSNPTRSSGPAQPTLTEEHLATAVAAHDAGRTWQDIAADLGSNPRTLRRALRQAGHSTAARPEGQGRGQPRFMFDEGKIASVSAARAAGRTWDAIAVELGIDRSTLRSALRRARRDDLLQDRRAPAARASRFDEVTVRALYARRLAGEPIEAMAAAVGTKRETLARAFVNLGLPPVYLRCGRPAMSPTPEALAAAVAGHDAGRSWRRIAPTLGVSLPTLMRYLRAAGYDTSRR